jgi:Virulence-associated protein E/Bifunctional DNA primase/polymerase, N-terminal
MTTAVVLEDNFQLRVFPLHGVIYDPVLACTCKLGAGCKDIGKHPAVAWRHYDENLKGPGGGCGIQTGHFNGIFVVDLDVSKGKNGIAALLELAAGREIPDTLSVLTPSGGVHLYFRLPPGAYVPSCRGLVPGVDIRGEGGFVVGPGSPHKTGGTYREEPGDLADPPDWLLEKVVRTVEPPKLIKTEHRTVDPSSPEGVRAVAWAREYLARAEPAVEGQGGSDRLYAACCHLMYSALPLDVLRELVEEVYNPRCEPPWSRAEIEHKLADADRAFDRPDRARGLCSPDFLLSPGARTKDTEPKEKNPEHEYTFEIGMRGSSETRKASFGEVCADLYDHKDWAGVLMYDTFRDRVVAIDPPMEMEAETAGMNDNDARLIRAWFEYHGKKINLQDARDAVETVARRHKSNSVIRWLKTLTWDGRPRLDLVLPDYFQSPDGEYERAIGPRWFISLIARAMKPGCQVDYTLILEGDQERRKSSALLSLMHDPSWYAENQSEVGTKDFYENMRGVWVMGFDELASLTNADNAKMKSALTRRQDRFRKSYGHYSDSYVRGTVFCGTIDCPTYLKDAAGGRRFWPVRVQKPIDTGKIERDRDQIFAEAFVRWQQGEVWHVNTPALKALCEAEQEARFEVDSWEEAILQWFNNPTKFSRKKVVHEHGSNFKGASPFDGSDGFTTSDVLRYALDRPAGQQTRADSTRVGVILRRLKLQVIRVYVHGGQERRYVFPGYEKQSKILGAQFA